MLGAKRVNLDARLTRIADLVGKCGTLADIGSDHGRLPVYLLQRQRVDKAYICDISESSLVKARHLLELCELDEKAKCICADGLKALVPPIDKVVIAGMGGKTICQILDEGKDKLFGAQLILQPNVAIPDVRRMIEKIDYHISDETVIRDGKRLYVIIVAQPGKQNRPLSEVEQTVGPVLGKERSEAFAAYMDFRIRVLQKALRGAEEATDAGTIDSALKREMEIWLEVKNDYRRHFF